jgi:glycosyltransferase involved in cell wall biosynthesis
MKVLQLGRYNSKKNIGGVQHFVGLILEYTKGKVEYDNLVAGETPRTKIEKTDYGQLIEVATYGNSQSTPITPGYLYWAWKLLRKNKYDLIHAHFPDPVAVLVLLLLPKKIPIVVTWHSDVIRQKKFFFIYIPLLKMVLKKVDAITVATPKHITSCEQLKFYPYPERIHVVPFGVDSKPFEGTPKIQNAAEIIRKKYLNKKIIFALGRLVYYKGFEFLVRAMKNVDAVLLLGGDGPLKKELQDLAQKEGVSDKIIFLGRMENSDIVDSYHACDVFCMPSVERTEAFGFVQVEAMLSGKPVVTCQLHNGVNYVSVDGETGFTVEPKNVSALSSALNKILKDPALTKKMGEAARARCLNEFSTEKFSNSLIGFYKEVLRTTS